MPQGQIYIDISELAKNPICTGIQRVEREILLHWTGSKRLVPCVFKPEENQFTELPAQFVDQLLYNFEHNKKNQNIPSRGQHIPTEKIILNLFNPEVFFDPRRSNKYIELLNLQEANISWLVYDFIPFLYPHHFPVGTPSHCMPYLLAMRNVSKLAFISHQTKSDFEKNIVRRCASDAVVFPLGGDGLKLEKQQFSPARQNFVYFGTIEPRKNVAIMLQAFAKLWGQGKDLHLYIVGRMDACAQIEAGLVSQLQTERRFHYLGHADDDVICNVLRGARATIFVSSEEGFGIPPLESLAAGIPVIASNKLPSLKDIPERGYLSLDPISVDTICDAVEMLMVDSNAARLWQEAAGLSIPTWRSFVANLSNWLHAC